MEEFVVKTFHIPGQAIRSLAPDHGACYASDRITVDGQRVGYMYREAPDFASDSGWRFFDGTEDQAYADDPTKFAIYDVNTIANYDSEIIGLLQSPVGAVFVRSPLSSNLRLVAGRQESSS